MLFDLRGRGRRRTVQIIYIGLAALMGVGLVGFGVGGGFGSGGIFSSLEGNQSSGAASHSGQIAHYEKLTRANPKNISAWENLTLEQLHQAGGDAYFENGKLTGKGRELFAATASSWERYIALNPPKPNLTIAKSMALQIFSEEGLNRPADAVQALQIIVAAEPKNAAFYAQLANDAYKAKNLRVGDLAAARAVALVPASQRVRVKNELEAAKKSRNGEEVLTGTTNGKKFTVKKAPNGAYTGAIPQTTPAPTKK
jgi:hypothetical protein